MHAAEIAACACAELVGDPSWWIADASGLQCVSGDRSFLVNGESQTGMHSGNAQQTLLLYQQYDALACAKTALLLHRVS